jgi:hypothetical protein
MPQQQGEECFQQLRSGRKNCSEFLDRHPDDLLHPDQYCQPFEEPFDSWSQLLSRQFKYLSMQAVNAAGWLGIMFLIIFVTLHVPRVLAHIHNADELTSAFVALGFAGASFIFACVASST